MKNPSGYGSVYKISGRKLRNPWRVIVTTGWENVDGIAKQRRKTIGYCHTRQEALQLLAEYNHDPSVASSVTFGECFNKYYEEHEEIWSAKTRACYKTAGARLEPLFNRKMAELRVADLEEVLDAIPPSPRKFSRTMITGAYEYALRHDIVNKDYSALIKAYKKQAPKVVRHIFTEAEMSQLWSLEDPVAKTILVGIYSGWRPDEVLSFSVEDDLMRGGSKTKAGKNRIVPIHHRIAPLLDGMLRDVPYNTYWRAFSDLMKDLGWNHTPHDTRHTCATLLAQADANPHLVKLILGHSEADFTERVYTHRTIEELRQTIELIK